MKLCEKWQGGDMHTCGQNFEIILKRDQKDKRLRTTDLEVVTVLAGIKCNTKVSILNYWTF